MMRIIALVILLIFLSCNITNERKEIKSPIDLLSESIHKDPTNTNLLFARATYNKKHDNLESALFDLTQCVKLDSLNHTFQFLVAETYFELSKRPNANGNYPSLAKHHLTKAIQLNAKHEKYLALFGELMLAYAKYKEAIDYFNRSLKIRYNQAKTHMLMGYAFKELGQDDNAINCFRNSVNVNPEFKEAFVQLGQIFHMRGDTTAVLYYDNALNIDPSDKITLYNKALFYQSILNWNAALEAYANLHKVDPFHSSGHYNIGFIHMELGLYDVGANNFSDAIYGNSQFFEAYYSRGNCFETLGNIGQAESDYKRAIEINPDYTFAIEALKELEEKNKKFNK
ncbi:tetratricopeptide repeat protein [Flavobacteriales bacterium]|nr:tetratricopeptide repeat protein [Flavobacteriales bacterium]